MFLKQSLIKSFSQTLLIAMTTMVALTSCGNYEEFKEDPSAPIAGLATTTSLSYAQVYEKVIGPSCFRCHGNYATYEGMLPELENGKIFQEIRANTMPQDGPLNSEDRLMLLSWIAGGYPEGEVVVDPTPIQTGPTLDTLAKGIFGAKCIRCHTVNPDDPDDRGPAPFALNNKIDLLVYATQFNPFLFDFEFPEDSGFVQRLTSDDPVQLMPPASSGLEPLTEEEREVVIEWIRRGIP